MLSQKSTFLRPLLDWIIVHVPNFSYVYFLVYLEALCAFFVLYNITYQKKKKNSLMDLVDLINFLDCTSL